MSKDLNLALAGATITDEPIKEFSITVKDYTWLDKLLRRPKVRVFKIYRCRVCNMQRAATIAHKIPGLINKDGIFKSMEELTATVFPLITAHHNDVLYLVAACIQNNSKEPKKALIRWINDNFTAEDLFDAVLDCIAQSGLPSFYSAVLVIKGTSALIVWDTDADPVTTPE